MHLPSKEQPVERRNSIVTKLTSIAMPLSLMHMHHVRASGPAIRPTRPHPEPQVVRPHGCEGVVCGLYALPP